MQIEILNRETQEREEFRVLLFYSEKGKVNRIYYILKTPGNPTVSAERTIEYDDSGKYISMKQESDAGLVVDWGDSLEWVAEYSYLSNASIGTQLWEIRYGFSEDEMETYSIVYNEVGAPIGVEYS